MVGFHSISKKIHVDRMGRLIGLMFYASLLHTPIITTFPNEMKVGRGDEPQFKDGVGHVYKPLLSLCPTMHLTNLNTDHIHHFFHNIAGHP